MTAKKPPAKKVAAKPVKAKAAPVKAPVKKAAKKPVKKAAVKVVVSPVKRPVGRPSAYKPEFCALATNYCLLGATDKELAQFFEVSEATVNTWKTEHPQFLDSIKQGREIPDANVARSLYQRACGYSHTEDDIRTVALGMNQGSEIVITPTVKHYPPDTQAASLWLRNRQPAKWRDKVEVEHGGRVRLDQLPDNELNERLAELHKRLAAEQ